MNYFGSYFKRKLYQEWFTFLVNKIFLAYFLDPINKKIICWILLYAYLNIPIRVEFYTEKSFIELGPD